MTASLRMASGRPVLGRRLVQDVRFGNYVVAMYAMAMRRGIATRTFIKDTVTPEMLLSSLETLVGDLSYGECLALGVKGLRC